MTWTTNLKNHETAPQVLTRLLKRLSIDIKLGNANVSYTVREFSPDASIDVNGTNIPSSNYSITKPNLVKIADELSKKDDKPKEVEKKVEKKVLKKKLAKRRIRDSIEDLEKKHGPMPPKSLYKDACRLISNRVGAPNIDMVEISKPDRLKLKIRSAGDINIRLEKMKRRAQYELKSLREIHADMKSTTNLRTKASISLLQDLYNKGKLLSVDVVIDMLFIFIVKREKDRLYNFQTVSF